MLRFGAVPEIGVIATASRCTTGLRFFALDGEGVPLHVCENAFDGYSRGLTSLGGDMIASSGNDRTVSTWRASSGERLETIQVGKDAAKVTALATIDSGNLVVGTNFGSLYFLSHNGGRDLKEIARGKSKENDWIVDIAVRGPLVVTASRDRTAGVWSAVTHKRLTVLRGHASNVCCVAVNDQFIATGSADKTIRLYLNGEGYTLVRVMEGLHTHLISHVELIGEDLLMSASYDQTMVFSYISSGKSVARIDTGIKMYSAAITPDGRVACVGDNGKAIIISPPALVAKDIQKQNNQENDVVKKFHTRVPLSVVEKNLPRAAGVGVGASEKSPFACCGPKANYSGCGTDPTEFIYAEKSDVKDSRKRGAKKKPERANISIG